MFYKNFFFLRIIIYEMILYSNCAYDNINISKINPGFDSVIWYKNTSYLYYIDIKNYYEGEENVVEFISGYKDTIKSIPIFLLTTNRTEEEILKGLVIPNELDIDNSKRIKKRASSDLYVYVNNYKKTSSDQTFFLILFKPTNIIKSLYVDISLSNRINNFNITNENFENKTTIKYNLKVRKNVEDFYKFIINDISVEEQNIIFFVKEYNIISFYKEEINITNSESNLMFLIQKNSTNKTNHVIFISAIGEAGEVNIEITLIKNDIIYFKERRNAELPLYIENIMFQQDIYIIEDYEKVNSNYQKEYDLNIIPLYGDFTLTFYEPFNTTDLEDLFNNSNGTNINKFLSKVSSYSNFYRLLCTSPCALKFGYINLMLRGKELDEGDIRINYIYTPDYSYDTFYCIVTNETKKYYLFLELYEDKYEDKYNYINANTYARPFSSNGPREIFDKENRNYYHILYFNSKSSSFPQINFFSMSGSFIKIYLTSNLLYSNIVEGLNVIDISKKNLAFKMRRDLLFDYVLINIYSHDKKHIINIYYDVKILSPDKIDEKGKVLCELPTTGETNTKELNLKYSNPYNKYKSKIKKEEFMFIVFKVNNVIKEDFPFIFDIKYYYNNTVVNIPYKEGKIIELNKEYKIYSEKEYTTNSYMILNINKCNINKNYSIHTFYENLNNIVFQDNITEKRNLILHNNIYNNTNIKVEEIIYNDINDTNYTNDSTIYNDDIKINTYFPPTNYLTNDDIHMNYFTVNESLLDLNKITNDFTIKYEKSKDRIIIKWSPYLSKDFNISELTIQYDLYILPKDSKVNSICQMSLIPPNYTVINKTEYDLILSQGKYKINIIASVLNNEFPLITFYDELDLKVSDSVKIVIYIVLIISLVILFIFIITLCLMNKYKKDDKITISKNSFWISLVEQRDTIMNNKIKNKNKRHIMNLFEDEDEDKENNYLKDD